MHKDFTKWNKIKADVNNKERKIFFNEREIWWCILGLNVGSEQDGKNNKFERPVLIIKKFNKNMFWGIPLTSKIKEDKNYHQINYNNHSNSIILSQLKLISSKRLLRRSVRLPSNKFQEIVNQIKSLF